jgi:hypothetical protein
MPVSFALGACGNAGDLGLSQLVDHPCVPEACPVTDQDAGSDDYRVALAPGTLISLVVGQLDSVQEVSGGEVVLSGDLNCVPSGAAACKATLKRLRVELKPIIVDTGQGQLTLEGGMVSYEAPLSIVDRQDRFSLPEGSTVHTCVTVQGVSEHASAPTTGTGALSAFAPDQDLTFEGSLPFVVKLGTQCTVVPMSISGLMVGEAPWAQEPKP